MINVSLDTTNIDTVNISTLDFRIGQYFNSNWTSLHLQKLANVSEVPVIQLYRNMFNTSETVHSFTIEDDDEDPFLILTILMHPGIYIGTIGIIFAVCIGVYCFKWFWTRPATPSCQPYSPVLFTTCHSGWWCRSSTHLQMQRHSWRIQKILQESWPAHWVGDCKARESL